MKFLRLFLLSVFSFQLVPAFAADRITVSITVTNGTENGDSFTLNSSVRTFTNTVYNTAIQVLTNSAATGTKTNLLSQIRSTAFAQVQSSDQGATNLNLVGNAGLAMSASVSGDWGFVTYTTQTVAQMSGVRVPVSGEPSAAVQTNIASALVAALNLSANTNELNQTSKAATQLLGTTNTQTVTGAKTFSSTSGVWNGTITNTPGLTGTFGAVSNGIWWNGVLRAPTLTNGVNYGNAFRSPGSGDSSEQFGSGAIASGVNALALGNTALASAEPTIAIGNESSAVADGAIAIGFSTAASNTTSVAIGHDASAVHDASVALGPSATTTAANQIRLGTSAEHVSIPGGIYVAGGATNLTVLGTNTVNGHLKFIRKANSALANGNNAAVDISTNSFVEVSGPTAAFSINGIANGSDGRVLILLNQTTYNMTIVHDSGVDPTAANRIYSLTGADRATTGNGAAMLIYSAAASRWILINLDE